MNNKVYEVSIDWVFRGEGGYVNELFKSYDNALAEYQRQVNDERDTLLENGYINEQGETDEGYVLEIEEPNDKGEQSWQFYEDGAYWEYHIEITLRVGFIKD